MINIRLAGIEEESIVDGPGIRLAIFTQGCYRNCIGCHNPHTHDPNGGKLYELDTIINLYKENPLYNGITFSGGEPFLQCLPLIYLAKEIKKLNGNVVTYTGYTYKELLELKDSSVNELLSLTDILIDGPFIEELKDMELQFRGSSNQNFLKLR